MAIILGNSTIYTGNDGSLWNQKWSKALISPLAFDHSVTRGFVYIEETGTAINVRMGIYEYDTVNRDNSLLVAQSAIVPTGTSAGTRKWLELAFNNEILSSGKRYVIAVTLQSGGPTVCFYNPSPGAQTEEFRNSNSSAWPSLSDPLGAASSLWTNRDSCMYLECEDASVPVLPPTWSTIPAQNTTNTVNRTLDVSPYASSSAGPLVNWTLVAPPTGFTINSASGVITCAAGTAPNAYAITARVSNNDGTTSSDPFAWTVSDVASSPDYTAVGTSTAVLRYTIPSLQTITSVSAFGALRAAGAPHNSSITLNTLLARSLPSGQAVSGTVYAAVRTSGPYTATDQAVVKAGTGAVWFDNAVSQYRQSFMVDGLPPNTTCYYGMYEESTSDSPVTFGSFTTQALPAEPTLGTPPTRRG